MDIVNNLNPTYKNVHIDCDGQFIYNLYVDASAHISFAFPLVGTTIYFYTSEKENSWEIYQECYRHGEIERKVIENEYVYAIGTK